MEILNGLIQFTLFLMEKFNSKVEQTESRTNWKSNRLLEQIVFDFRGSTVHNTKYTAFWCNVLHLLQSCIFKDTISCHWVHIFSLTHKLLLAKWSYHQYYTCTAHSHHHFLCIHIFFCFKYQYHFFHQQHNFWFTLPPELFLVFNYLHQIKIWPFSTRVRQNTLVRKQKNKLWKFTWCLKWAMLPNSQRKAHAPL